jgi:hypothetical protein
MSFIKDIIRDLKDEAWPPETTLKQKNKYRWKIVGLMSILSAALFFIHPVASILPALVAIRKIWIILKDNG